MAATAALPSSTLNTETQQAQTSEEATTTPAEETQAKTVMPAAAVAQVEATETTVTTKSARMEDVDVEGPATMVENAANIPTATSNDGDTLAGGADRTLV